MSSSCQKASHCLSAAHGAHIYVILILTKKHGRWIDRSICLHFHRSFLLLPFPEELLCTSYRNNLAGSSALSVYGLPLPLTSGRIIIHHDSADAKFSLEVCLFSKDFGMFSVLSYNVSHPHVQLGFVILFFMSSKDLLGQ